MLKKIIVYKDRYGAWRWKAMSVNNKILADSGEGYTRRNTAKAAAKKLFGETLIVVED